jgi:hypothetical protein
MKKLLIMLMAVTLFAACNNNKDRNDRDRGSRRDRDDYNSSDRDRDSRDNDKKNTDYDYKDRNDRDRQDDDRRNDDRDDDRNRSSGGGSWSSSEINQFVSTCTDAAEKGGMQRSVAAKYCDCMQVKLEKMYPNAADAGGIDVESPAMKKEIMDCLR